MTAPERQAPAWPERELGPPTYAMDNVLRYRAQSALTGLDMADDGPAPILPIEQARDVVAWIERREGWGQ